MPLLGFTVFKDKILDGSKKQTIRKLRKIPIKKGDKLYLYWKLRTKQCEKLFETICIDEFKIIFHKWVNDLQCYRVNKNTPYFFTDKECEQLAILDGFEDYSEMTGMLYNAHKEYFFGNPFQVIRWESIEE